MPSASPKSLGPCNDEGQGQELASALVPTTTEAIEVCGPPCSVLEDPAQVAALVQALNDGGAGFQTCAPDQVIYTVRFREAGAWGEAVTVPAVCGSTQGTAEPSKATDQARDLLQEAAEDAG